VDQRAAGGEHRIEHDDRATGERLGQLVDVRLGLVGRLVAGHADEPDVGVGQQRLRRADEAETGAQDRHHDRLHGDAHRPGGGQRRLDRAVDGRQRPGRLGDQQPADALEVLAEQRVRRVTVADLRQCVGAHGWSTRVVWTAMSGNPERQFGA
jgi:hypothetical protein